MTSFDANYIRRISIQEIEKAFYLKQYDEKRNQQIAKKVISSILNKIDPNGESPYKFITQCTISRKDSGGFDVFSNNYWDEENDGMAVIDFENSSIRFSLVIWGVI